MDLLIADLHSDMLSGCISTTQQKKYLNADIVCTAVFTKNGDYSYATQLNILEKIKHLTKVYLCFENLHFLDRVDFEFVEQCKPLYAGLTWNEENCLCSTLGITQLGVSVIKKMEQNNILVDSAHLPLNCFFDLIDISQKPIINSHTCFMGLNEHKRNLTDEQIRLIIQSGGIVGLTFVQTFLSSDPNVDVSDIVRHIDYFCCKFDCLKLCLASDYFGSANIPRKIKNYKMWVNLLEELLKIGYNKDIIEKIFYWNFHDFLKEQRRL